MNIKLIPLLLTSLCLSYFGVLPAHSQPADQEGVQKLLFLPMTQVALLRQHPEKWRNLHDRCDKELSISANPVQDYSSQTHYTATGAKNNNNAYRNLANDVWVTYRSALCFVLSQDQRYAQHAKQMLSAWSRTLKTVSKGQGYDDISANMPAFILAASWVRDTGDWDESSFQTFLRKVLAPASTSDKPNNHGNWGVLLDGSIAAYLRDEPLLRRAERRWISLLASQIAADATLPLEICRSATSNWCGGSDKGIKGLAYSHYALMPTSVAAQILWTTGRDVYASTSGKKLGQAFAKVAAWTLHPETFPYYASNQGELIDTRNAAYFALLQKHYPNDDAAQVLRDKLGANNFEFSLLFGS